MLKWTLVLAAALIAGCGDAKPLPVPPADASVDAAHDAQLGVDAGWLDARPDTAPQPDTRGDVSPDAIPDAGPAAIWPVDATRLIAHNHGGGFTAPPPAGSVCPVGESLYTMTVADRKLVWHLCRAPRPLTPLAYVDGERILTPAELDGVVKQLEKLTPAKNQSCGADKPTLTMKIAAPAGEIEYTDSFYRCLNRGIYVDGMDDVFSALRMLTP